MRLGDRIRAVDDEPHENAIEQLLAEEQTKQVVDPFLELKQRVRERLYAKVGSRMTDPSMSEAELRQLLVQELQAAIAEDDVPLAHSERRQLVEEISRDVIGYGPIQGLLDDPSITEIMVLADDAIYVERNGLLELTDTTYVSQEHLRAVIERIVSAVGRRIDESSPTVDARLPDGSRVNAVIPPLAVDGPQLTIRKFSKRPLLAADLIQLGTFTPQLAEFLAQCVRGRLNILVSGGTGTGKTTMLNTLSASIPDSDRIVTIEDAVELRLNQSHVVRLEARPPNIEGRGQVTIRDLVRNSLRMRPDRIVVGEVRGAEALDMLQAMNTGHEGSLSTLHSNSPRDALSRLETMVLMAGFDLPIRAIREQVVGAVDLIVHLSRLRDGRRMVTRVVEVEGLEGDVITLSDLFHFESDFVIDAVDADAPRGQVVPTGVRPKFETRLADYGEVIDDTMFGDPRQGLSLKRAR